MKTLLRFWSRLVLIGIIAGTSVAQAELLISGRVYARSADVSSGDTTVFNAPDGSFTSFTSGRQHFESFEQHFFEVGSGLIVPETKYGMFLVENGFTPSGTTGMEARFDLFVEIMEPTPLTIYFTRVTFVWEDTWESTEGGQVEFHFTWTPRPPVTYEGHRLKFSYIESDIIYAEPGSADYRGDIRLEITPVPEASTFAWGARFC